MVSTRKVTIKINDKADIFLSHVLEKKARVSIASDVFKNIGSESITGTNDIIRGLPPEMEEALMPRYLGITRQTDNYDKILKDFWADFTVKIFLDKPIELDMSTRMEQHKINGELKEIEVPVNLDNYMKAYFALQSSQVAKTADERANAGMYDFHLQDLGEAKVAETKQVDSRTKAMKYYLALYENAGDEKAHEVMLMLSNRAGLNYRYDLNEDDMRIELSKVLDLYPDELIKLAEDKHLAVKAKVKTALNNGFLIKEGDTYFLEGDDIPLARGLKEMLNVFNDVNKAKQVAFLNAKLEQLAKLNKQ